ncbi:hypothetical protein [Saccharibacillus sp. JS10]|uniref:hypothetical protein n=1 Tax=Saccharibacillus sp. JS10 TaxID=2950552 RepID=UPI00210C46A1|nr:hypothetical protein [Saccharibacillus sp. JS10]MCQ4087540.1 hypothetical protein [Saccharibacillus sp. JS10]
MGTQQQVELLENTLVEINVALRFNEPVSSKDLNQITSLLQELVVPHDRVAKKISYLCCSTLINFQNVQADVPSDEKLNRVQHQLKLFQRVLLSSFESTKDPEDEVKKINNFINTNFESIYKNPKQAKKLLSFLDFISLQYKDERTIPKTITFYLYHLLIRFMNEEEIVELMSTMPDGERSDLKFFFKVCNKIENIFVFSKES